MIRNIANFLEKVQLKLGVFFLSLFFFVIVLQMFVRYIGVSLIWTEEVATYSFIWAVFMGASVMIHRRGHFRFSLLYENLTGRSKIFLEAFIDIILVFFSIAVLYYGIIATTNFWNYNWYSLTDFKMGYMFISIPTMGFTMFIYGLDHLVNNYNKLRGDE